MRYLPSWLGAPSRRTALLVAGFLLLSAFVATAAWIAWPLPPDVASPGPVPSLVLQDRAGRTLRTTRSPDGARGGWIALKDIDPEIIRAFLATEDERFFSHRGVDLRAIARAARDNIRAGRIVSGASTITMQTARLLRPLPRTWVGKLRQALWAFRLEAHLDKHRILEIYLNRLPLGQGTRGISAAAELYFGAEASDVRLGQAALLAALAHAPSQDNPFVSRNRARVRRSIALNRLVDVGYLSGDRRALIDKESLAVPRPRTAFEAPHFTTHLLARADYTRDDSRNGVIRTSLDLDLQHALEAEVRHIVEILTERRVQHAAAVVLHVRTGEVLAWIGSPDFWADTAGQVDMVVSRRQPGSALKPFLYGLAFDRGYTPASVLPDIPKSYRTQLGTYRPRNYDRRFRGPVRARESLASSYNVPAVELTNRLGVGSFLSALHAAGFESLDRGADHYGVGIALGNGDVTLLEVANAYRALVNGGVWLRHRTRPTGSGWDSGEDADAARVISATAATLVLDVLSDPNARIPGFGVETPFDFPFPVAVKTGTSRRFTDNWAVGATGEFIVAVWVGNFSGRPMDGVSGITGAGPLLQRAVFTTAKHYDPGHLSRPEDVDAVPVTICRLSGKRATRFCPTMVEWLPRESAHLEECDWHDGHGVHLPDQFAEWAQVFAQEAAASGLTATPPSQPDRGVGYFAREEPNRESHGKQSVSAPASEVAAAAENRFRIISPQHRDRYRVPPGTDPRYATVALRSVGTDRPQAVRWFIDGEPTADRRWRLRTGSHIIRAEAPGGDWDEIKIYVD